MLRLGVHKHYSLVQSPQHDECGGLKVIGGMHDKRAFAPTFKHLHDCTNLVSNMNTKNRCYPSPAFYVV